MSTRKVVVLGAAGFTGELVVRALGERGAVPVVAGRNREKLEKLVADLGTPTELAVADVTDPASVEALVGRGDVLISTVGPFVRHGQAALQAAIAAGAHYFDSTGEGPFVREVFNQSEAACWSGATLLTASDTTTSRATSRPGWQSTVPAPRPAGSTSRAS